LSVAAPSASSETPLPTPAKKSTRESLEMAWEVVVLGVLVGVVGGFLQPAILSTVVTWIGTAITVSGIALLVRCWTPLHDVWTKAFELGVAPLLRELARAHSKERESTDDSKPTPKKAA
jgi:hypothetical protein